MSIRLFAHRRRPVVSRLLTFFGLALTAAIALPGVSTAQEAPPNGMRTPELRVHAITNATVVTKPGETIEKATIIIRDGVIEAVGTDVRIPREARLWNAEGRTVYPGLIDPAVIVDIQGFEKSPGSHWNRLITPELHVGEFGAPDDALRKSLRDIGITTAAVYPGRGILRGSGMVVSTAESSGQMTVYRPTGAMAAGLERTNGYPGSIMGSIALLRQTLYDAKWHQEAQRIWAQHPDQNEPPIRADSLVALQPVLAGTQSVLFQTGDELDLLRAAKVMDEFALRGHFLGSGLEFRRLREVVAAGRPIIVPLEFPDRPDVTSLASADNVNLSTMLTWEQAPANPARLLEAGATITFTTNGLSNRSAIYENLQRAMVNGLTEDQALEALTVTPAKLLGLDHLTGTIERGKLANLIVVEGKLFDRRPKIRDVWVEGRRFEISADPRIAFAGSTTVEADLGAGQTFRATAKIDTAKSSVSITPAATGDEKPKAVSARNVQFEGGRLLFLIEATNLFGAPGYAQAVATYSDGGFVGSFVLPDGTRAPLTMMPTEESDDAAGEEENAEDAEDAPTRPAGRGGARADAGAGGNAPQDPLTGTWRTIIEGSMSPEPIGATLELKLAEDGTITGRMVNDFFEAPVSSGSFDRASGEVQLVFNSEMGQSRVTGRVQENNLAGTVAFGEMTMQVSGSREAAAPQERTARAGSGGGRAEEGPAPDRIIYPLGAYGIAEPPRRQDVLVRGGTIWTAGDAGIIENGDLLIEDGRIVYVGPQKTWPENDDRLVIDATGKHITPGLIDAHSHTGISGGVNEMGQVNTAEVRIADVVDPDDVNWYRQLAGGLTAANQLHGSANPIGGQNSVVKIKWGGWVDDFRIDGAKPGIKFALGENVKRSSGRYPNTRMGVETVMRDAFIAAREYRDEWNRYNALPEAQRKQTIPPRRDLELDTLVEILEGERLVHCHSYRQDEILMLLRVADEFGFTVGTLQHILEGYKVAEAIAEHGAGASSFSDWWAYKIEVMDAIPYNGAIMHDLGVVVSFNSDSSELARRMNTEAAKAVRYGGVEPHEALTFVTLNPAKQLRIDHRTGSLEKGKDGDFVIWSDNPLSTYAICEQTWIEGAQYFSLERDAELRAQIRAERQRLIQKILELTHGAIKPAEPTDEDEKEEPAEEPAEPDTVLRGFSADLPF